MAHGVTVRALMLSYMLVSDINAYEEESAGEPCTNLALKPTPDV